LDSEDIGHFDKEEISQLWEKLVAHFEGLYTAGALVSFPWWIAKPPRVFSDPTVPYGKKRYLMAQEGSSHGARKLCPESEPMAEAAHHLIRASAGAFSTRAVPQ
jgi:hypothetical protein